MKSSYRKWRRYDCISLLPKIWESWEKKPLPCWWRRGHCPVAAELGTEHTGAVYSCLLSIDQAWKNRTFCFFQFGWGGFRRTLWRMLKLFYGWLEGFMDYVSSYFIHHRQGGMVVCRDLKKALYYHSFTSEMQPEYPLDGAHITVHSSVICGLKDYKMLEQTTTPLPTV